MEITIKDKTYKVKYSIRAMFVFEKLTGKLFKLESADEDFIDDAYVQTLSFNLIITK